MDASEEKEKIEVYEHRFPNFNLQEFLKERDYEWKSYTADDHIEFAINCPACKERGEDTPDTKKKLWINYSKGYFYCYRCDYTGSLLKLVQKIANITLESALRVLRGRLLSPHEYLALKVIKQRGYNDDSNEGENELREVELPYGYRPVEGPHQYLDRRNIPWRYAARNDWGYSTAGYTKGRIIVPTFMDERLVFWQARYADNIPEGSEIKKILNPKGVSARHILYNYDIAKHFETIILTEGFIDAVKAGENAVATNGKNLHPAQVEWLQKSKAKTIIIAWDYDAWTDGNNFKNRKTKPCSMKKAIDLLKAAGCFEIKVVKMPPDKDCGSFRYGSQKLKDILAEAKPFEALV